MKRAKVILKAKSYTTSKICCKSHKSLIQVTKIQSVLKKSYIAECMDCGSSISGHLNVRNLLITTNPILTSFLLNKANQN